MLISKLGQGGFLAMRRIATESGLEHAGGWRESEYKLSLLASRNYHKGLYFWIFSPSKLILALVPKINIPIQAEICIRHYGLHYWAECREDDNDFKQIIEARVSFIESESDFFQIYFLWYTRSPTAWAWVSKNNHKKRLRLRFFTMNVNNGLMVWIAYRRLSHLHSFKLSRYFQNVQYVQYVQYVSWKLPFGAYSTATISALRTSRTHCHICPTK